MDILIVDTGNEKLDEAYKSMQVHISAYDDFISFENYFNSITEGKDKEELFKWLLKVLYWEFKYGRHESKHKFDLLLEKVDLETKEKLETWLDEKFKKVGGVI